MYSTCIKTKGRYIFRKVTERPEQYPGPERYLRTGYINRNNCRPASRIRPATPYNKARDRDYPPEDVVHRPVFFCHFYPNVTTLRLGLCYRNSVCRLSSVCHLSVCLSVCLSSVTLVHPTQGVEPFGKISSPLCTLAIL